MTPIAHVVLNADDFGLAEGIDRGILALLAQRRISAVSVMAGAPLWERDGPALAPFVDAADIGMHFFLTEVPTLGGALRDGDGRPLTFGALQRLTWQGRLSRAAIRDELSRQWQRFRDVLGRLPAHLDSHQHVHQLPTVRAAVLDFLDALPASERPYVRTAVEQPATILRRGIAPARALAFSLAGRRLRNGLRARGVRTNDGFSGVYDFRPHDGYRPLFRRFLRDVRDTTIVICHPGVADPSYAADPIAAARTAELRYFQSEALPADLAAAGVALGRFGS